MAQCEFCGQYLIGKTECDCSGATHERKIQEQIASAADRVRQLFVENAEDYGFKNVEESEIVDLMLKTIELLARSKVYRFSVTFAGGTAKLSVNSSGKITVERSRMQKYKLEE